MTWPFDPLRPLSYDVVMADPPWAFALRSPKGEAKSAQAQYDCMSLDAIKALPVSHLARGDCWLWLWATHPMLPQALDVMAAWGFTFVTSGVWVKSSNAGNLAFGTGYILRSASEPFLIGKIGAPRSYSRSIRTVVRASRREHSRKPDDAYAAAEALFGRTARRADLFAREARAGWEGWGHEAEKFNEVAA